MPCGRTVVLRLIIVTFLILAAIWGSLCAYAAHEVHRATSMLAEASRVGVGDTEASVLPLIKRYDGYKWTPDPLPPREQSTDLREYDYRRNHVSDYQYDFEISPFGLLTTDGHGKRDRVTRAVRTVTNAIPKRLRAIIGLRDWGATVDLAIRGGRVQSVSGEVLVEGRSEWLGHEWRLVEAMPHSELQPKAFVIGSAILEMENGGGMLIQNIFTPDASVEEVRASRKFNAACLSSVRGCEGFCDLAPRAVEYLKQHPDAGWGIIPPKCP
ncbi:MAG: hypothetical protein HY010_14820 [Acidobacteria bacterium]|nr:hypothetical protein [Acidobacteriota bacterium]